MSSADPSAPEPPETPDCLPLLRVHACTPSSLAGPPLLLTTSSPLLAAPLSRSPPTLLASPPLKLRRLRWLHLRRCFRPPVFSPLFPTSAVPPSLTVKFLCSVEFMSLTDLYHVLGSFSISTSSPLPSSTEISLLSGRPPSPPIPPDPPDGHLLLFSMTAASFSMTGVVFFWSIPRLSSYNHFLSCKWLADETCCCFCPPPSQPWLQVLLCRLSLSMTWRFCRFPFGQKLNPLFPAVQGLVPVISLHTYDPIEFALSVGIVIIISRLQLVNLPRFEALEWIQNDKYLVHWLLDFGSRQTLPQYEDSLPLYEDSLPQYEDSLLLYEAHLPQYEDVTHILCSVFVQSFSLLVVLPYDAGLHLRNFGDVFTTTNLRSLVSNLICRHWKVLLVHTSSRVRPFSQLSGSSSRCFVVSVAKFLVASFALVAEVCSGNVSPSVLSFSQDFISLSTVDVIISSCLNGLYVVIIYVYTSRFAFVAAVDYAGLAIVLCFSNFCSVFGE